jgi:hypothetical protein
MATTALIILTAVCLLVQGPGSVASMVAATMADGVATTVAAGAETTMDSVIATNSAVAANSMAMADGMVIVDSTGTRAPTTTSFMVVVDFVAVTGSMVVTEDPTEEAIGSRNSILLSHLNGWQPMLPAVFLLPLPLFRSSLPGTPFS